MGAATHNLANRATLASDTCADVDQHARHLVQRDQLDAARELLVTHAAPDRAEWCAHREIHLKARLDAFSSELFDLPITYRFAMKAAKQYVSAHLASDNA